MPEPLERPPPQDEPERPPPQDAPWRWPERTKPETPLTWSNRDPVKQWAAWRLNQLTPEAVEESVATAGGPFGVSAPGVSLAAPLRWKKTETPQLTDWHFDWHSSQKELDRGKYELYGSGYTAAADEPNVMRNILMGAAHDYSGIDPARVKIGFAKAEAAWREIQDVLQKHGINVGEFHPVEGQLGNTGPKVSRDARVRFNEMITGSKATKDPYTGKYRIPLTVRDDALPARPPEASPAGPKPIDAGRKEWTAVDRPDTRPPVVPPLPPGPPAPPRPAGAPYRYLTEERAAAPLEDLVAFRDRMRSAGHTALADDADRAIQARERAAPAPLGPRSPAEQATPPTPTAAERAAIARAEQSHGAPTLPEDTHEQIMAVMGEFRAALEGVSGSAAPDAWARLEAATTALDAQTQRLNAQRAARDARRRGGAP